MWHLCVRVRSYGWITHNKCLKYTLNLHLFSQQITPTHTHTTKEYNENKYINKERIEIEKLIQVKR